jgi:hypothetical protein
MIDRLMERSGSLAQRVKCVDQFCTAPELLLLGELLCVAHCSRAGPVVYPVKVDPAAL